ncbi:MAG: uracil-DNA glycosylase [Bacteroidia bacterium]
MEVNIEPSWKLLLKEEFEKPYFSALVQFVKSEKQQRKIIYPPGNKIFEAFAQTSVDDCKVVILGQDPYHGPNQAHGLCFSVNNGIAFPPSLQNIFKELSNDIEGFKIPQSGNLTNWAKQGVLLLNATLTVRAGEAGSHQNKGWEIFTDAAIAKLAQQKNNLVFMLWGKYAQSKEKLIPVQKHLILKAPHPSPLSAHNGFFGCRHFSLCNQYLKQHNKTTIIWQL